MRTQKTVHPIIAIAVGLGVILIAAYLLNHRGLTPTAPTTSIQINNHTLAVEIADTDEKRMRGLSGRTYLAPDHGMLFMFPKADVWQFWMRDMRFPLDILWLDAQKKVIGISPNLPPMNDINHPVFYTPLLPAQFVIEVNAGFAARNNIQLGDQTQF